LETAQTAAAKVERHDAGARPGLRDGRYERHRAAKDDLLVQVRPLLDTVGWPMRLPDEEAAAEAGLLRRHARAGRPHTQEEMLI